MSEELKDKLTRVSRGPGVYLMKDAADRILYVGKARNLKSRLASYFSSRRHEDTKTAVLLERIRDFETIVTATEQEALILESTLIKAHQPRYNVILRDDKRYPVLRMDTTSPYPNLTIVRRIVKDGALYFGPYPSGKAVRQTLQLINKTFKLRKCRKSKFQHRSRPCLHCQMGQCLGPCCVEVPPEVYDEMVREVVLFLSGRTPDLIRKIEAEMMAAAEAQEFERAATLRDKLFSLRHIAEKQVVVSSDLRDRDVLGITRQGGRCVLTLLIIRGGYLVGHRHFDFKESIAPDDEIITAFIRQYYEEAQSLPGELLLPTLIADAPLLAEWLRELKGSRIRFLFPRRGEKTQLIAMARQNAENHLKDLLAASDAEQSLLERLQRHLKLERIPYRIECFDNSHTYGSNAVSGMVVFEAGKPRKSEYRTYKMRQRSGPDDYASMAEVIGRRFKSGNRGTPMPDLVMVDGGRGQLQIAREVLAALGLEGQIHLIAIAKKDERRGETLDKIFLTNRTNPVNFGRDRDLLLFLQRIRDEAHRFAIGFHRRQRRKAAVSSALDAIAGIGEKRKRALLRQFGGLEGIRSASMAELLAVPGMTRPAAEAVKSGLADIP
jgi:excinuclease ABC subunit C